VNIVHILFICYLTCDKNIINNGKISPKIARFFYLTEKKYYNNCVI
jgi:hypothetical protein